MEDDIVKLSELSIGESAEIVKVGAVGEIKKRLMEMGVIRGAKVEVERFAPMGDPIEIFLMGYHMSLRRSEAEGIEVKRLKN